MAEPEYRRTIAQDLLRELLEEARREAEREQEKSERLRTLIRAGRLGGLGPTELAEASGLSRPGVYEVLRRDAPGAAEGLDEIVLAAIAAGGPTTRESLHTALKISEDQVYGAVHRLVDRGELSFAAAGYEPGTMQEIILMAPQGERILRGRLRRALSSRPEHWTVFIGVRDDESHRLLAAARERFGRNRTALLPDTTTTDMTCPELAISFDVADLVGLFNEAARAWHALRNDLALEPTPVVITSFSPPRRRSSVLEAFGRGIVDAYPQIERSVMRAVADAGPDLDEFAICVAALTQAAWALRQSVDQHTPPPELRTSDEAFQELQAVVGLHLDPPRERIQEALVRALERATDRLGPIPGGRLGSFRAPGEQPNIVEGVEPTPSDLAEIARASGEAVGFAHVASDGVVSAVEGVKTVSRKHAPVLSD